MLKFPFPELTVPFPQARCGELRRSKYLCCQTPFCLHISFYRHFVNQLKPHALENTDERTLKLQWLFTITHRNTHEWNRTLNLYKLIVLHRSYKLMTLIKSTYFVRHIIIDVGEDVASSWRDVYRMDITIAVQYASSDVYGVRCVQ